MRVSSIFDMASWESTSVMTGLFVILVSSITVSWTAEVINPPRDVTVGTDQTAVIQCGVRGVVSNVDPFKWQEFQTNSAGADIYRNPPGEVVASPSKYQIDGEYDLQISNTQLEDGGLYACGVFSQTSPSRANLVVLDQPSISVGSIIEGDLLPLNCVAQYGAPLPANLNPGQLPDIHMRIGDHTPLTGNKTRIEPILGSGFTQLRMIHNYVAQGAHNGQELKCSVSTSNPSFNIMTRIILDVRFSVRDLKIAPLNDEYYVGDTINCTAYGNPDPTFRWEAVPQWGSSEDRQVSGNFLVITNDMIGDNTWKCVASNTVSQTEFEELEISFLAVYNPDPTGRPVTESGVEAWVIAVAIIIPVIVVCIAIIAGILYYRRKKANAAGSGNAEKTPGYENKDFTGSANPVNDGVIPPDANDYNSQQKKPDYPVSMNPNPNGTPAGGKNSPGDVPVYPPTHSGKDSPGYGDLGVRHLSGSGAQLNVSQDSFDDGPQRGPPAQYSNTPGSGPPPQQRQPHPQQRQPHPQQMYQQSGPPDTVV